MSKTKTYPGLKPTHARMCCAGEENPSKTDACWCTEPCCWQNEVITLVSGRKISVGKCICPNCGIHVIPRSGVPSLPQTTKPKKKVKA